MKRQNQKAVILAVGVVIVLIGGCGGQEQEQDMSKSEMIKRERLIAAEKQAIGKTVRAAQKRERIACKTTAREKGFGEKRRKPDEKPFKGCYGRKFKTAPDNRGTQAQVKQSERELEKIKGSKKSELEAVAEENVKTAADKRGASNIK